jgi:maleylpyruvate isomerase
MVARQDKTRDPAITRDLLLARRGQAYFSRKLNELRDDELSAPTLLDGWSRRHVIAHVGYNARGLTRLLEWASTGVETPMYETPEQRREEIDFGATLPAIALRNLSDHAAVHLTVEWRDLDVDRWSHPVRTALGREVPVSETPWMRAREVWIHAVDLGNGGDFAHFPVEFIDRLLGDIASTWSARAGVEGAPSVVMLPTDRAVVHLSGAQSPDQADIAVEGLAVDLARWASGRGRGGVATPTGEPVPAAPRWI